MKCPSGIMSLYVNMICYLHTATIDSVPAMWREEVQAEVDRVNAENEAKINEKLSALEEAHEKLASEASEKDTEETEGEEETSETEETETTTVPSEEPSQNT